MTKNKDLASAEELLKNVIDSIPMGVFWKDLNLNYLGANQKLLDDIGFKDINALIGQSDYAIYSSKRDAKPKRDDDMEVLTTGKSKLNIEEPLPIDGKKIKWLRTNKVPIRNEANEIIGVLGTYQDITKEVNYRQLIEQQAYLDPLTGLANKRELLKNLSSSKIEPAGLLFIDLDNFKDVNDSLGHAIGDKILIEVAKRLRTIADNLEALLVRLGGDEFSLFKKFRLDENIRLQMEEIAKDILESLSENYQIDRHIISSISASIGISILDGEQKNVSDGFIEADIAMYSAKSLGRNNFQFFNKALHKKTKKKHEILNHLHNAIVKNELKLYYQPQFNANNQLTGAEALLRWENPELGNISPNEFIPIAEDSGLIDSIGLWVIDKSIKTLSQWHELLIKNPNFRLSINVSSKQFQNESIVSTILERIESNKLSSKNFAIEITESSIFDINKLNTNLLTKLKNMGFNILIDDFGTGFSSLSTLSQLPINTLKIDQSFIRNITQNKINEKIVETVISLAKHLEIEVIAEGVENEKEIKLLEKLGCSNFQGYFFNEPLTKEQFNKLYI